MSVDPSSGSIDAASASWISYGHAPDELVGQTLTTLIHPEDRAAFEVYLLRPGLADGGPELHTRMLRADGSWVASLARVRHLQEQGGAALVVTFLPLDDITARTVEQERRAADQLQMIDDAKHRLLEVVSHELRTPLTVVSGFAETLQRDGATFEAAQLRRIGASIERHAARLQAIVTDLIDLDRASRESLVQDADVVDLAEVVREVVAHAGLDPRELHVELESVSIPVDRIRFARIVACLLDNVRRHTPVDTKVGVSLTPRDGGAMLEVTDDGPGLPEELRGEVFTPFAQGALRDTTTPGLGLGLALVRRFTELHGGRCWHSAPEDGGARFSVVLPGVVSPEGRLERFQDELRSVRAREMALRESRPMEVGLPPESLLTIVPMLRAVRRELGMQVVYFSKFTATEQVVLATHGDGGPLGVTPGARFPLADTYCVRMVEGQIPHVVGDTRRNPRLASLPATAGGIACYVGVPVHLPNGHVIGSLCGADGEPDRELAVSQTAILRTVAQLIGEEFDRQEASTDEHRDVTGRVRDVMSRPDGIRSVFQPIVELATGDVAGVEALSRFPDSRLRPPDLWFADAATVGLAGELEQTAVHRALAGLAHLPGDRYLSINLSPQAISTGGLRPLLGRVPLERIVIEITEHAAISDYAGIDGLLRPFRDGGARLAIDDVGAGFASLRHVLRMHPDVIKLDRSLVSQITTDPAQHAITVAFVQLARELGTTLVAEGIEDAETFHALARAGVTHGQGWLFDRPGPLPLDRLGYTLPSERSS